MDENFASESYEIVSDSEERIRAIRRFFRRPVVKACCMVAGVLILLAALFALAATLFALPIIILGVGHGLANTCYRTTDYMLGPGSVCVTAGVCLLMWGILRYLKEQKNYLTLALIYSGVMMILGGWSALEAPVPFAISFFTMLLMGSLTGIIVVGACIAYYWGLAEKVHPNLKGLLKAGTIYAGSFGLIFITLYICMKI